MKSKVKKYIKPHKRKGAQKLVTGHKRTYHKKKKPRPGILHNIEYLFTMNPRPLTQSEISKYWKLHPDTTKKYLKILEKKKIIKKVIINDSIYWELL